MSRTDNFEYYCRRERQERDRAIRSLDPAVIAIHLQMAERFAELKKDAGPGGSIPIPSAGELRKKDPDDQHRSVRPASHT